MQSRKGYLSPVLSGYSQEFENNLQQTAMESFDLCFNQGIWDKDILKNKKEHVYRSLEEMKILKQLSCDTSDQSHMVVQIYSAHVNIVEKMIDDAHKQFIAKLPECYRGNFVTPVFFQS